MARQRERASRENFAGDIDGGDADHGADAACQLLDDLAVTDIDRGPDPVFARFRTGLEGCQLEPGNARLIEQTAERRMDVAGEKLQMKHSPAFPLSQGFLLRFSRYVVLFVWMYRHIVVGLFSECRPFREWNSHYESCPARRPASTDSPKGRAAAG
ncbi:MAG TPA: hypothetical protein VKR55_12105 [Bradyrhizobium sp.]|uniref:hypothetical protein n=1 Tax=Bradyrhizobium sp. TaxID=376 RepID=UPI002B98CEA9|nr:hypothetical protein [Bradyrhizobium sp.]HLZ02882.1 hypothetical protein [Bradyrhizobium sp.]